MRKSEIRVLLAEDNPDDAELTCESLSQVNRPRFKVTTVQHLHDVIRSLKEDHYDVLLLDLGLPESQGLPTLQTVRSENEGIPIIVLTGLSDEEISVRSLGNGAQDYLVKCHATSDGLARSIRYAIHRQKLVRRLSVAKHLLEKKNQRLARLYKMAHRFVDNVSHEFRTPLTVIKEYVALMREEIVGPVNDEQAQFLDIVSDRSDDLNTMVDDMLDVSKVEAGMLAVIRKQWPVSEIIDHVRPALINKATVKGVTLEIDVDGDLPDVYCDAEKIGRVIINLSVNAIKFCGRPGRVQLWARHDAVAGEVVIGVTDDGPGIDDEKLTAIFKRFKQLGTDCRGSTKGFGLGLNIAKELVDLNFGEMTVDSKLGEGSTFSFTLPVADPVEVMRRYLARIEHLRHGSNQVSLVHVSIDESTDAALADDTDTMLSYLLRRNDLLFRLDDHQWLCVMAVGDCELHKFYQRLKRTWTETNRNRPSGPLPKPMLEKEGTWLVATHRTQILERFMALQPTGEELYA